MYRSFNKDYTFLAILAIMIIVLASCKMAASALGYYKKPRYETKTSIIAYAQKHNAKYDLLYITKSIYSFNTIGQKYGGIPATLIFDKRGRLLSVNQGSDCPWKTLDAIKSLVDSNNNAHIIVQKQTLDSVLTYTQLIAGNENTLPSNYDYTIVYIWAKYSPKLTRQLFSSINQITTNTKRNIRLLSIDNDLQASWGNEGKVSSSFQTTK